MDIWERARVFAGETAKRSQELVSNTAKEIAAEATKKADLIRSEALRAAGQLKTMANEIPIPPIAPLAAGSGSGSSSAAVAPDLSKELERFGVTEELREFVEGIQLSTFRDFPMEDEQEMPEVPTVSNVRQDLNEWQARHATLVLSTVKEISKFRYELCPRYMKERKFWQIYFVLVNTYISPYEKQYMEELKIKSAQKKDDKEGSTAAQTTKMEAKDTKLHSKASASSNVEQDLDEFLLGGSDEEYIDDASDGLVDKIGSTSGIDSDEDIRKSKESQKANSAV
ncbi:uncharacterized protein [Typha angustifolia]|uniref:uncharacterized protein isoform X1 n=1 Tax=Typha angustifolia TaxID=59011 RepID=UPI003C2ED688